MTTIKKTLLLSLIMLTTGCSSALQLENWLAQKHSNRVYQNNPGTISAAIVMRESNHSPYSKNGYNLWLRTLAHYRAQPNALTGRQLTALDYLPLTSIQTDSMQLTFSYDSRLNCPEADINSWQEFLASSFPELLFQQFQLPYDVRVRFVSKQSFHFMHRIDPVVAQLNFYFPADCQDIQQEEWRARQLATIIHEITHIEQFWIFDRYSRLVQFPEVITKSPPDPYRLLDEYIAHKMDICAMLISVTDSSIPDKPIMRFIVNLPTDFSEDYTLQNLGVLEVLSTDYDTANFSEGGGLYSTLGELLANDWLAKYADDEGFIFHSSTMDDNFIGACQSILSEEAIIEAGQEIKQLLTK